MNTPSPRLHYPQMESRIDERNDVSEDDHIWLLEIRRRLGGAGDTEAVDAGPQGAEDARPNHDRHRAIHLDYLDSALHNRFIRHNEVEDIDDTVAAYRRMVELASQNIPELLSSLSDLGCSLFMRYELREELDDLNECIFHFRRAVEHSPDGHQGLALYLNNLGSSLFVRFDRLRALSDLDASILAYSRADDLTSDEHASKAVRMCLLGTSLRRRFMLLGRLSDIEKAVALHRRAIVTTPETHPGYPAFCHNLGLALSSRFDRLRDLNDVDEAILMQRRAVELTQDGHPGKVVRLQELGISLSNRFDSTRETWALEETILAQTRAVCLAPDSHPKKAACLNDLGLSLCSRFELLGKLSDVEEAIAVQRRAIELTPDGHPDLSIQLNNLGNSLCIRFERLADTRDLNEAVLVQRHAVDLTPDENADKAAWLSNLGVSLSSRYELLGEINDLRDAVSGQRRAIELAPDTDTEKPDMLNSLGLSLCDLFERLGDIGDLEEAISVQRHAIDLTLDDNPHMPGYLHNLSCSLRTHYQQLGEPGDLENAITVERHAIELTPEGHPYRPSRLNELGVSLRNRFHRFAKLQDLQDAILAGRLAVELTPDGRPDKPSLLTNLGLSLLDRFDRRGEVIDVDDSITAQRLAVDLTPDGHPGKPALLNNQGVALYSRFIKSGKLQDIDEAISLQLRAVEITPEGSPDKPMPLTSVGRSLRARFNSLGHIDDFRAAVSSFMKATVQPLGTPSIRLQAAKACVDLLTAHTALSSQAELLAAHARILDVLPEIVWLGHGIRRRFDEASQLGDLVNAAVSVAIGSGELEKAVEWLEAGRALIWSQVLSLRPPLDELREVYPTLADSLQGIQKQLQASAHMAFTSDVVSFGGVAGITVSKMADDHRILVVAYEKLLKQIRECTGFEDFLRPKRLAGLLPSPELICGPVIFINAHLSRCDAIVILDGGLSVVPLPELSLERARRLRLLWSEGLTEYRNRVRDATPSRGYSYSNDDEGHRIFHRHTARVDEDGGHFLRLFEYIWRWIVNPVLQSLDLAILVYNGDLPHITWCPTGPLTQLPLHAAGLYNDPMGPRTFDFVVSSYIPSLSSFLRCAQGAVKERPSPSVLIVTQPATPGLSRLPETQAEGLRLQSVMKQAKVATKMYDHKQATVEVMRSVMEKYTWIHLACHGSQNRNDATKSAFELYDGPLTLTDLMGTVADKAELAFLSACQTALGDEKTPEESAHLAAGMLTVGFKGLVATMWSIQDADAPIVVEAYYEALLALRSGGALRKGETGAAYALHEAAKVLRDEVGENDFKRWVPFVHFGV